MKVFIIFQTLLFSGVSVLPFVEENNKQEEKSINFIKDSESIDIVDLTMSSQGNAETDLPILQKLLNDTASRNKLIQASKLSIDNSKKILTFNNSSIDVSSLRFVLGQKNVHFDRIKVSVSANYPYQNIVTAYWTASDIPNQMTKIIGGFNWKGFDMSAYWSKDIKFGFELFF